MAEQSGALKIALGALDTTGGIFNEENTDAHARYITRLVLHVTTKATAACTLDVGIDDDGATVVDNLIDGLDVNTAAGSFDNIKNPGSNGLAGRVWPAGQFLTGSMKTGAAAGLVGSAYVNYINLV